MTNFTYTQGEWKEGADLPEWLDNEDHSDWLSRAGFRAYTSTKFGNNSEEIKIYNNENGNFHLAEVVIADDVTHVLISDFPSLMMFIRDFGSSFSLSEIQNEQEGIRQMIDKFFRLYHGHDSHNVCSKCDPHEWQRLQEMKKNRNST